jgi:hypothetical protein
MTITNPPTTITNPPATEHVRFEKLCEQVEDYRPLPTVKSSSPEMAREADVDLDEQAAPLDEQAAPLDGLILAGLVSP